ncbi:MAG: hypothetical protein GY757_12985, partial [bacterium]|nr:hypothetical protein [bacterium]
PVEVKPGQTLHVSIESVNPGYQAPSAVLWVNAADRSRKKQFPLAASGQRAAAAGELTAPAKDGLYQLVFHIPIHGKKNTYATCHGPLFTVR